MDGNSDVTKVCLMVVRSVQLMAEQRGSPMAAVLVPTTAARMVGYWAVYSAVWKVMMKVGRKAPQ